MTDRLQATGELPPVLSADQVAELLHLPSRREVLKLARRRVLPVVRLGPKRIVFLRDSVVAALKKLETCAMTDEELASGLDCSATPRMHGRANLGRKGERHG